MGGAGPVQVKDSPLLLQQIDAMQLSIKHLKNENNQLKVKGAGGHSSGLKGTKAGLLGSVPGEERRSGPARGLKGGRRQTGRGVVHSIPQLRPASGLLLAYDARGHWATQA